jgi:acetoin utilization protein AcuC
MLPEAAQAILMALSWGGGGRAAPDPVMLQRLQDPAREGIVRAEIRASIRALGAG